MISGREARHADEVEGLAFGERVADAQVAVIGDADDVAGIGLVGDRAVLGEEEMRRVQSDRLAGAHVLRLHAAHELARAQPREGDAVAVVRIHVGLDLEHEGRHLRLLRGDAAGVGCLVARGRGVGGKAVEQVADAEVLQRAAEEHRGQVALAERREIERPAGVAHQRELLGERSSIEVGVERGERCGIHLARRAVGAVHQPHRAGSDVEGADEVAAAADRPGHRRGVEGERLLDLVEQVERIAALAIHLVDEGDDRDVAQPAHLEQLAGPRLDALRRVDHHHGGIDRGQRAVGVLARSPRGRACRAG